jgi:hypothetical protein
MNTAVPEGTACRLALRRIDPVLNPDQPFAAEPEFEAKWQGWRDHLSSREQIEAERARQ